MLDYYRQKPEPTIRTQAQAHLHPHIYTQAIALKIPSMTKLVDCFEFGSWPLQSEKLPAETFQMNHFISDSVW